MNGPLLGDDRYVAHAACTEEDTEMFFPPVGGSTAKAKAVCRRCPVLAECRDYAMQNPALRGVWGGLSERERQALRSRTA